MTATPEGTGARGRIALLRSLLHPYRRRVVLAIAATLLAAAANLAPPYLADGDTPAPDGAVRLPAFDPAEPLRPLLPEHEPELVAPDAHDELAAVVVDLDADGAGRVPQRLDPKSHLRSSF